MIYKTNSLCSKYLDKIWGYYPTYNETFVEDHIGIDYLIVIWDGGIITEGITSLRELNQNVFHRLWAQRIMREGYRVI